MSIETFVNGNAVNVRFAVTAETSDQLLFEVLPERFARMFEHDSVNDDADPVFVYIRDGEFVAWYDLENACGYVADLAAGE